MITWNEEITIPVDIESIWELFDLNNLQRIMPQIIDTQIVEKKDGVVGSIYQQTYQEKKRTMTYLVTDLAHENTPDKKYNKSGFKIGKLFAIEVSYTLIKLNDNETKFIYSGQNRGINFLGRLLLKVSSTKNNQKEIDAFVQRVKLEALKERII